MCGSQRKRESVESKSDKRSTKRLLCSGHWREKCRLGFGKVHMDRSGKRVLNGTEERVAGSQGRWSDED